MKVAILHPGEMGAGLGRVLVGAGHDVGWAAAGRSESSRRRAESAGLRDAGSVASLVTGSEVVISVCPPHAAPATAAEVAATGFDRIYVDANAIAPSTARSVAAIVEAAGGSYVDAGIVGGPPGEESGPRFFLSGDVGDELGSLFDGTVVEAIVLDGDRFAASALKISYAAWTKGSAALLLTAIAAARRAGVAGPLTEEWARSQPRLEAALARAESDAAAKGWRWVGEMEEIAVAMGDLGLPEGFHRAAAEVFDT
jgi:3-hydroxyisobutyrate dehydrogenase-like beta-hydroxyacid dehydrogenase